MSACERVGPLDRSSPRKPPQARAISSVMGRAYVYQLTLVTRNVRDFDDCRISLLNPFS
jgi:hypothetical protein